MCRTEVDMQTWSWTQGARRNLKLYGEVDKRDEGGNKECTEGVHHRRFMSYF